MSTPAPLPPDPASSSSSLLVVAATNVVLFITCLLVYSLYMCWKQRRSSSTLSSTSSTSSSTASSTSSTSSSTSSSPPSSSFWLLQALRTSDHTLLAKCGPQAALYDHLLRSISFILCLASVVSCSAILPYNILASSSMQQGVLTTTIFNHDLPTACLWPYTAACFCYICSIFAISLIFQKKTNQICIDSHGDALPSLRRTVLVRYLPSSLTSPSSVAHYFNSVYGEGAVVGVVIPYNFQDLESLQSMYLAMRRRLQEIVEGEEKGGETSPPPPRVCVCVRCRGCCFLRESFSSSSTSFISLHDHDDTTFCCCKRSNESCYLQAALTTLSARIVTAQQCPLVSFGGAIVELSSTRLQKQAVLHHHELVKKLRTQISNSSLQATITLGDGWSITAAPSPHDIIYEYLAFPKWKRICRSILVDVYIFVLIVIIFTPTKVLHWLSSTDTVAIWGQAYLPSAANVIVTFIIVPIVLSAFVHQEGYYLHGDIDITLCSRFFIYFILGAIVLPLFPWRSLVSGFGWLHAFGLVLRADRVLFAVQFMIQLVFWKSVEELLKLKEIVRNIVTLRVCVAGQLVTSSKFPFAINYGKNLGFLTFIMLYGFACPLVFPLGLVAFLVKRLFDRHLMLSADDVDYHMASEGFYSYIRGALTAIVVILTWAVGAFFLSIGHPREAYAMVLILIVTGVGTMMLSLSSLCGAVGEKEYVYADVEVEPMIAPGLSYTIFALHRCATIGQNATIWSSTDSKWSSTDSKWFSTDNATHSTASARVALQYEGVYPPLAVSEALVRASLTMEGGGHGTSMDVLTSTATHLLSSRSTPITATTTTTTAGPSVSSVHSYGTL